MTQLLGALTELVTVSDDWLSGMLSWAPAFVHKSPNSSLRTVP